MQLKIKASVLPLIPSWGLWSHRLIDFVFQGPGKCPLFWYLRPRPWWKPFHLLTRLFNATSESPRLQCSHLWFIQHPAVKSLSCNTSPMAALSFWDPPKPTRQGQSPYWPETPLPQPLSPAGNSAQGAGLLNSLCTCCRLLSCPWSLFYCARPAWKALSLEMALEQLAALLSSSTQTLSALRITSAPLRFPPPLGFTLLEGISFSQLTSHSSFYLPAQLFERQVSLGGKWVLYFRIK